LAFTPKFIDFFLVTQADVAIFGKKDFQQLRVIEQMVRDLNLPLTIVPHPIVRETDGLAISSRNRYLSDEQREEAVRINKALGNAIEAKKGNADITVGEILQKAKQDLSSNLIQIEYVQVSAAKDLVPQQDSVSISSISFPRLFIAARLGTTRLIDNVGLTNG